MVGSEPVNGSPLRRDPAAFANERHRLRARPRDRRRWSQRRGHVPCGRGAPGVAVLRLELAQHVGRTRRRSRRAARGSRSRRCHRRRVRRRGPRSTQQEVAFGLERLRSTTFTPPLRRRCRDRRRTRARNERRDHRCKRDAEPRGRAHDHHDRQHPDQSADTVARRREQDVAAVAALRDTPRSRRCDSPASMRRRISARIAWAAGAADSATDWPRTGGAPHAALAIASAALAGRGLRSGVTRNGDHQGDHDRRDKRRSTRARRLTPRTWRSRRCNPS